MTLLQKKEELLSGLAAIKNSQDRFAFIVNKARQAPSICTTLKTPEHKVEGCLSNLWFVAQVQNGKCFFQADADSMIVKAIANLLCEFYSGYPGKEILEVAPEFLEQVGITQHLSSNRRNGLTRLWQKISDFAHANP